MRLKSFPGRGAAQGLCRRFRLLRRPTRLAQAGGDSQAGGATVRWRGHTSSAKGSASAGPFTTANRCKHILIHAHTHAAYSGMRDACVMRLT